MHLRSTCLGLILAVAVFVALPGSAAQSPAAGVPDLSGRWRLDSTLSDKEPPYTPTPSANSAAQKEAEAAKAGPPGTGGGRGGEGGGHARGAHPATAPTVDDDPRGARQDKPAAELVVTQTEPEIVVEEKPGTIRRYYPNGRTYKADEGQSEIKSQWRDGRLVFEKKGQQGWRLTETWQVAPDRSRLTIEMHLEGGHRPKTNVKRVYQRVEPTP